MGPRIVSMQTNPDLSLTVAGGRQCRRLNDHLLSRTSTGSGYWSRMRAMHGTTRSVVTGAVLVDERCWLAKVSGSQGCQVVWGEDMSPCCRSGLKRYVAGVTAARQSLLCQGLASHRGSWRFSDCQLNRFGQNRTIGFESTVLEIGCRAHVHLSS